MGARACRRIRQRRSLPGVDPQPASQPASQQPDERQRLVPVGRPRALGRISGFEANYWIRSDTFRVRCCVDEVREEVVVKLRCVLAGAFLVSLSIGCPPEDDDVTDAAGDVSTEVAADTVDVSTEVAADTVVDAAIDAVSGLQWWTTCGDPVCSGHTPADPPLPLCTDVNAAEGQSCPTAADMCDPVNSCNARMVCADADPKAGPGGCPISRRAFKTDVAYLSTGERDALAAELLTMPLATWRYLHEGAETPAHLGFIIEDIEPSAAVQSRRDRGDLYGYTTMAVATIQQQQRKIEALEREMQALKKGLRAALDARVPRR